MRQFDVHDGGRLGCSLQVSQIDLENALLFANRSDEQRALLRRTAGRIRASLKSGGDVEAGVHTAEVSGFELRGVTYQALLVDGRPLVVWADGEVEDIRRVFWV